MGAGSRRIQRDSKMTSFAHSPQGSQTEWEPLLSGCTLKRAAFESWRTGYSSAFAIILFVTVFGLANIYVKALNRVKSR